MRKNIIFIVIDALRTDMVGCYGNNENITPNIDSLAEKGIIFKDAYACINTTDPSLTTIFSGRYPINHGLLKHGSGVKREDLEKVNKIKTLPERLQEYGYNTYAIDWLGRWHRKGFDYYSGSLEGNNKTRSYGGRSLSLMDKIIQPLYRYESFVQLLTKIKSYFTDYSNIQTKVRASMGGDAKKIREETEEILEKTEHPFFIFLHFWDTHFPYNSPDSKFKRFYNKGNTSVDEIFEEIYNPILKHKIKEIGYETVEEIEARYKGSINYVDEEIGKIIKSLKEKGIFEDTLIIVTSDHGESLTEHDIYFDHHGLYEPCIHVPLIMSGLNVKNKIKKGFVQHVDIYPTILDIIGMSKDEQDFDGQSLYPFLINNERIKIRNSIFVEESQYQRKIGIRTQECKYISSPSKEKAVCRSCKKVHGGVQELYNLKDDPEEKYNIFNGRDKEKMEGMLKKWLIYLKDLDKKREKETMMKKIKNIKRNMD